MTQLNVLAHDAAVNVTNTAIARCLAGMDAAKTLEPGTYEVDTTVLVRLSATVKKSRDTEATPTTSIPLIPTVALLLEKCGFRRNKVATLLRDAMIEALELNSGTASECIQERMKDVEAAVVRVKKEVTSALPKVPRSGQCRVDVHALAVEVVESGSGSDAVNSVQVAEVVA